MGPEMAAEGKIARSHRSNLNSQHLRNFDHPTIVGRELDGLPLRPQVLDRGQVQRIERANRQGKRFQCTLKDHRRQLNQRKAREQGFHCIPVCPGQLPGMKTVPYLVDEQSAGHESFTPHGRRRCPRLCKHMGQDDR